MCLYIQNLHGVKSFPAFRLNSETKYLSVFSPNAGKCGKNADQNNYENGHFLRSAILAGSCYTYFCHVKKVISLHYPSGCQLICAPRNANCKVMIYKERPVLRKFIFCLSTLLRYLITKKITRSLYRFLFY